ncbi:MFS general substrate transporter [Meredithblackwellia eburnea MCA 4105]
MERTSSTQPQVQVVDSAALRRTISNAQSLPATLVVDDSEPLTSNLSRATKVRLLLVFCLSVFVDVLSASAFFVFTSEIVKDLDIVFAQQSWVITSYTVTFASFLLFWGRVCDLFSSKTVFVAGFFAVGICNIILSFLKDRFSFFIIRSFTGVAAASLVPSAYRLISLSFPPEERGRAYTTYGMTGSIANVTGTIIAGTFALIPNEGQMRSWRWFLRVVAAISIPTALAGYFLIPSHQSLSSKQARTLRETLKVLDLVGISSMLTAIILLILGLTFGASFGWTRPAFLVPFLLSFVLVTFFFWWENRIPEQDALLPPSIWRIPNIAVLLAFALLPLGWWGVNFLSFIELFHNVHEESMILAAVRTLPEGIIAGIVSVTLLLFPPIVAHPRVPLVIAMLFAATGYILWTQAPGVVGIDYWKFILPGMLVGSGGMQTVLLSTNVCVMLAAPPERTGVIGAALQTAWQTSTVVALSIQAGLLTVYPGGISNVTNVRTSWYFELGWTLVWLVGFIALYKPLKQIEDIEEAFPVEKNQL